MPICSGSVSGPRVSRGARTSILSSLRDRLCALRPSQQKCCPRYHTSLLSRHTCCVPALCLLRFLAPAPTLLPSTRCAASTFASSSSSSSRSSARHWLWCHRHSATAPLRSLRTSPLFLTHYPAHSFLSASTVYALSARHGSSCSVLALTRPSLSFSASSRALASTKVSGCSAEEAVMRVNSDNAATPRRSKKAQAARKALPATGKRKYTRRAGATVPTPEVNGANDTTVGVSASGSAISATDVTYRPSSQRVGSDASDTDAHDVHKEEEVYNKQYELSPEETYQQTSARLMLPLHAVQFVLAQAKEGATVPFLARYRRGETGRMDETQLRLVMDTAKEVAEVHRRRQFMLRSLESRGLLTPALHTALKSMTHVSQLEDAWEPYKERRTSLASRGRAAGLGPYAAALLGFNPEDPECKARLDELSALVRRTDDGERLLTAIVAEDVQRSEELRRRLSEYCRHTARLSSTMMTKPRKKVAKELHKESFEALRKHFAYYDNKSWSVQRVAAHVVLALERGEAKGALKVDMVTGPKSHGLFMHAVRQQYPALNRLLSSPSSSLSSSSEGTAEGRVGSFRVLGDWRYARKIIQDGLQAAYDHLIKQTHFSIRRDLRKSAEQEAIVVFAHNLHHMLLQRPLTRSRILAMDPGLANGVKCVALDEHGAVETFFTCTLMDEHKMRRYVIQVVESRKLNKIVIGNGTASGRATELVADIIKQQQWTDVEFAIVSEAGASVYSVSDIAKEEFPDLDVMYRGAVSIGRRVLDPLSELVKIPVRSMGIGMYQHDVNEKDLMKELNYVLGSCVAKVGVNAASANRCVMEKVPGISKRIVDQIVLARHARKLLSREDLRRVPAMTESVYQQIAGFFRFPNSPEPLDNTNIHPESYPLVRRLVSLYMAGQLGDDGAVTEKLEEAGDAARIRQQVAKRLERMSASQLTDLASEKLLCSVETLELLRQELLHPALDPRASLLHAGLLRREVCDVKDLRPGQLLSGVVQSVTMFGAFVDCGLHDSVLLRGEGVDALQVGMYLDQRIRFDCLDHLKRPRVFLVRAVAAPSPTSGDSSGGAKAGAPSTAPRRLRLESEDILSSDGRGLVSQAEPDAHLYDSLATDAEGVTALAPTLTARVMQERRRRAEEALGSAKSPSVMGALRAATSSQTTSPSRASLSHPPVTKRARAELGTSDAFHQARRRVETVVAVSAAACPQATPSVPSPPCPAVKSAPGTLSASTSQMSKPTSQRVDVAGGGVRGQDGASSRIENTVFSF